MSLSRRAFVRAISVAGASAIWSAQVLARGREAAIGEGLEFVPAPAGGPIRLNSNENPVGPPKVAVEALLAALVDAPRYPGSAIQQVREKIASHHRVDRSSIVLGSGSGEILRMAVYAFTGANRPLVTASPTFEDPGRYAGVLGAPVDAVPVTRDLKLDLDVMAARAKGAGLVFACNPNNPTGTVHGAGAIAAFIDAVRRASPETTVLIDEAYHEYVGDPRYATAIPRALERPGVVVTRTFSKLYGMAGLRLGYGIGHPDTIAALGRQRLANSVNVLVAPAAAAALDDVELLSRERARNRDAREFTRRSLAEIGYDSLPSEANFILVDVRREIGGFQRACRERGVLIGRPFPPLMTHARISIGTMEEMSRAVDVFRAILTAS
jgi:histidinol-phosphate aminotransferase